MVIGLSHIVVIWIIGLILWVVPWPTRWPLPLHDVGKTVFVIAFAVWLGLFH